MAVYSKVDHGRQAEPGTARYSAEKTHHVLYFGKAGASRISNMIPRGHMGTTWGPPGDHLRTSYMACLGIIWGMFGHYLGQSTISAVLHASDAVFQTLPGVFYRLDSGPVQGSTCRS